MILHKKINTLFLSRSFLKQDSNRPHLSRVNVKKSTFSYSRYICEINMGNKVLQVVKWTLFAELYTVEIDFVPHADVRRWFPWQHDVSCRHVVGSIHVSFYRFYGDFRRCIWCWKRTKIRFIILSLFDSSNSLCILWHIKSDW